MTTAGDHGATVPVSARLFAYGGTRYEEHSVDPDFPYERRLALEPGWRREDFPVGSRFSDDPDDPWVSFGAGALEGAWQRTVTARWRGCPVRVAARVRTGEQRGRITVLYAGTDPAQADAAGFLSNPYQYWWAHVEPAELEHLRVEERELEHP